MKLTYSSPRDAELFDKVVEAVARGVNDAAHRAADEGVSRARQNISSSGNFGKRWTDAVKSRVREASASNDLHAEIDFWYSIPYGIVFEQGATIRPRSRRFLWIPVDRTAGLTPSKWIRRGGRLAFVMTKSGVPLLLNSATGEVAFIGVQEVHLHKRWNLDSIFEAAADRIPDYYEPKVD